MHTDTDGDGDGVAGGSGSGSGGWQTGQILCNTKPQLGARYTRFSVPQPVSTTNSPLTRLAAFRAMRARPIQSSVIKCSDSRVCLWDQQSQIYDKHPCTPRHEWTLRRPRRKWAKGFDVAASVEVAAGKRASLSACQHQSRRDQLHLGCYDWPLAYEAYCIYSIQAA